MLKAIERLLLISDSEIMGLNAQAAAGTPVQPERGQFSHLLRHFLERFFNHETASPDGDAKARMVLIACSAGLPPFLVALYLWPVYHAFIPGGDGAVEGPPPYWIQVNHHFFFVVYSFVAMGIATVFQWDLLFPDRLDVLVLNTLPVPGRRLFLARIAAIAVLIAGFLFDANILATVALPAAIDPPSLPGFLAGHLLATAMSGIFAAALVLALQSILLFLVGERWFRKISLLVQGVVLAALLLTLLLFPVYSGATAAVLGSGGSGAGWFPPAWFLGIYQRLMEGSSALPVYSQLAKFGCEATIGVVAIASLAYPLAYRRRVSQLVQGGNVRSSRSPLLRPIEKLIHGIVLRSPVRRAVFHFIGQTLLRVPRYRIYLALYGGVGAALVVATVVRIAVIHGHIHLQVATSGMRAAIGIVPLWTIAGLDVAFTSSGNRQGNWIFGNVHGRRPQFAIALEMFAAARIWAYALSAAVTLAVVAVFRLIAPPGSLSTLAVAAQLLFAVCLCVTLSDAFFLNVTTVPFSGEPQGNEPNLAFTVYKYLLFFPPVVTFAEVAPVWMGHSAARFAAIALGFSAIHFALRAGHRKVVKSYCESEIFQDEDGERLSNILGQKHLRRG